MKQDEEEWVEYQQVMEDVIKRSGLNKSIFYDLRGNHDNFGVPAFGDSLDFFSKYSLNGQQGRNGLVNSVTIQVSYTLFLYSCYMYSSSWLSGCKKKSIFIFFLYTLCYFENIAEPMVSFGQVKSLIVNYYFSCECR